MGQTLDDLATATDNDIADLSSFKISNKLLNKIGELARDAYSLKDNSDMEGLTKEEWTLIEEIITGFENR
jgi:hypothetical protein